MGTIADKLELLRRTKERQRAYLEQKYPLLDFDNIPFRAYLDLFQGRSYVPGFVLGVKAYGRSNNEDASTRDILPDYSGNGRDIKLYNFAFAGNSGYNGFVENTYLGEEWGAVHESVDIAYSTDKTKAEVSQIKQSKVVWIFIKSIGSDPVGTKYKLKARIQGLSDYISLGKSIRVNLGDTKNDGLNGITEDGVYETEFVKTESSYSFIGLSISVPDEEDLGACSITFEQIPDYPGALVSDGVDDYGQCIKDFALPDDYTVVAIRRILDKSTTVNVNAPIASKSVVPNQGAFIFEQNQNGTYSYGDLTNNLSFPALFSYQSKGSYNGQDITAGSAADTGASYLFLFKHREAAVTYRKAALYDLRIYDHSLTAEELQTVKDEMMTDYENATGGGIADVTYVADWDAKGRSNDEEETMRSQWTDKVNGRVINLNNYAFAGMSGWGGEVREDGKPSYPGALVSDGVDDHGVSADTFSEEIGTMLGMWRRINLTQSGYVFDLGLMNGLPSNPEYQGAVGAFCSSPDNWYSIGNPKKIVPKSADSIYWLTRTPEAPNAVTLKIQEPAEPLSCALYRLIFIKEQLDDAQVEFLKWKVEKEYRDWCKANGYEYAINEMLNN